MKLLINLTTHKLRLVDKSFMVKMAQYDGVVLSKFISGVKSGPSGVFIRIITHPLQKSSC